MTFADPLDQEKETHCRTEQDARLALSGAIIPHYADASKYLSEAWQLRAERTIFEIQPFTLGLSTMGTQQSPAADERPVAPTPANEGEQPTMFKLAPAVEQALAVRRYERSIMSELAKTNWGQNLDKLTLRAIADWGERHGIDVAQEIDVLGNRIYLNARYYLRGLAHLIEAGKIQYVVADHVQHDDRLSPQSPEYERRLNQRIIHGLPDHAVAAVVARVKLRGVEVEFTGAQWCGGRGKHTPRGKNYEVFKDPIGEERPQETAETRALRRCLRLMVTYIPGLAQVRDAAEDAAVEIAEVIHEQHQRDKELLQRTSRLPSQVADGDYSGARELSDVKRAALGTGDVPTLAPTKRTAPLIPLHADTDLNQGGYATAPDPAIEGEREPGDQSEPDFQDDTDLVD